MTFDINSLLVESVNTRNILTSIPVEETYFLSTLKYVKESKDELRKCTEVLYKGILESGEDYQLINESFSSFFEKVKVIIDKIIAFIKNLFKRFMTALHALVSSDKFIKKNKAELNKFNSKHEFKFDGYRFTFDDNVPKIDVLAAFNADFVGMNLNEIEATYKTLIDSLQYDYYDKLRAEIIGQTGSISVGDYQTDLFSVYRDGLTTKSEINVEASDIAASLLRFETYKKFETDTKKTRDKIEKDYNEIKKTIKNMIYRNTDNDVSKIGIDIKMYDGSTTTKQVSRDTMTKIDLFIKAKIDQIIEMSNIHSLAYSYKLDAIRDCFKQDKSILYRALGNIQKNYKLESVSLEQRYSIKESFEDISINELNMLDGLLDNHSTLNKTKNDYPEVYKENEFFVRSDYYLRHKEDRFSEVYEATQIYGDFTESELNCELITMNGFNENSNIQAALTYYCGNFNENAESKGSAYIAITENYKDTILIAMVNTENGNIAQINVPYYNLSSDQNSNALLFDEYSF